MANELVEAAQRDADLGRPLSPQDVKDRLLSIQRIMREVMKESEKGGAGGDYGLIPGCGDKPALLKPGAEKLFVTFGLSADPVIVSSTSTEEEIRYVISVRVSDRHGRFVGAGIGSCSSKEEKHGWREAVCDEEWQDAAPGMKRVKFAKRYASGRAEILKVHQVRRNPADVENTILKMAKKRALVDAALTVCGASDIFTQDIEEQIADEPRTVAATVKESAPKTEAKAEEKKPESPKQENGGAPAQDSPDMTGLTPGETVRLQEHKCPVCAGNEWTIREGGAKSKNPGRLYLSCSTKGCKDESGKFSPFGGFLDEVAKKYEAAR